MPAMYHTRTAHPLECSSNWYFQSTKANNCLLPPLLAVRGGADPVQFTDIMQGPSDGRF